MKNLDDSPRIIQGGMGVGISGWALARAVSLAGGLGVVSGTALAIVMARRLQDGDMDGSIRKALDKFPDQRVVTKILDAYYLPGGRLAGQSYRAVPMYSFPVSQHLLELTVISNFVEVYLAKEGHSGPVGINLLEKIQLPNIASLYGAMLAGVDYVLMGAGIPWEIPGVLDRLARHEAAAIQLHVADAGPQMGFKVIFDPSEVIHANLPPLRRPNFLAIISSSVLALALRKKTSGEINGFVIENEQAGGHNAPPRGGISVDAYGEPIYSQKDMVDFEKIRALGLPFWVAGASGHPEKLKAALGMGAVGIQVGTLFALCRESGLREDLRQNVLTRLSEGNLNVRTDPFASPTSFPFKVIEMANTLSEAGVYEDRPRRCDLGYLRHSCLDEFGKIQFRCPGEPIESYVGKGGREQDTVGKKCLCNGLVANIGLAQRQPDGYVELPLLTAGKDLSGVLRMMHSGTRNYSAADVMNFLQSQ